MYRKHHSHANSGDSTAEAEVSTAQPKTHANEFAEVIDPTELPYNPDRVPYTPPAVTSSAATASSAKTSAGWLPTPANLQRMVLGELSLGMTFWWYGGVLPALLSLGLLAWVMSTMQPAVLLACWTVSGAYALAQTVGMWLAADRYSGSRLLANIARVLTCLAAAYWLLGLLLLLATGGTSEALESLANQTTVH